jgi:DNA-binding CsgD family transcriptional regulator
VAVLHELIKRQTGRAFSRPVMVRIAEATGGSPFNALEVGAELGRHPPGHGQLPVPASLSALLEDRIGGFPERTREALLVAAMLSRPSPDLVDVDALEAAERAGLVSIGPDRVSFSHPLLAAAVYDSADGPQRHRVHRRLAKIVSDPEERSRHLALGAVEPDRTIAADLDRAAATAGSRGAPQAAADLMELALALTSKSDPVAWTARLISAARFWFDAGDLERSQENLERALAEPSTGAGRAHALQLLGQLHSRRSSFVQALTAAIEALESAGADLVMRSGIELDVTYYLVSLGDFPAAEGHAHAALRAAESTAQPGAVADALAVLTMAEFLRGRGFDERRMATALKFEDPSRPGTWQMRPSFIHALMLLWTCRLRDALSVLSDLHRRAIDTGEESAIPFLCFYLFWANLWIGDLGTAARMADEARETAALLGDPASRGIALTTSALLHAHDGSASLACEEARDAIGCFEGLEWPAGTIWPVWALGLAHLLCGSAAEVDATLGPVASLLPEMGAGDPVLGVFLPDEIEALIELGQLERAEVLLEWLEERAVALESLWALAVTGRGRALLYAARGEHEAALAAAERALAIHDRTELPFERARTLLVWGRLLRRRGRRAQAKSVLREALAAFDQMGTAAWADRARADVDRLEGRRQAPDELTRTESQIAELAASGISNREIAEKAFLTTKAVEANLTRVYRKLGIRSRGAWLERSRRATGTKADAETKAQKGSARTTYRVFPLSKASLDS